MHTTHIGMTITVSLFEQALRYQVAPEIHLLYIIITTIRMMIMIAGIHDIVTAMTSIVILFATKALRDADLALQSQTTDIRKNLPSIKTLTI